MNVFPVRLLPGTDLRKELEIIMAKHRWSSCWIMTGIGSLSQASLRFAGQCEVNILSGDWEICSLGGTLCTDGGHLHMVVADEKGHTFGGHVGHGNIIRTTAEIVLGFDSAYEFSRKHDQETGYAELVVQERSK